ncbi:MAG: GGDEF domain-containing protein [Aeoliella sp.]
MSVHPPYLGAFLFDQQTQILLASNSAPGMPAIFHHVEVGNTRLTDLVPLLRQAQCSAVLDQNDNQPREFATQIAVPDGPQRRVLLRFLPLAGADRPYLLMTVHQQTEGDLSTVQRDALTGLPDRSALAAQYQRWQQAAGANSPAFAVLFMDLDRFKSINDRHGHAVGDRVLVELANRWQGCVREADLVARYGGDEFVVLLAGITSHAEVAPVITRLSAAASRPIVVEQDEFHVGVTIGVAIADSETSSLQQLLTRADRNMYDVKQQQDPKITGKSPTDK